ncbi:MAG: stage III sporulation protein AB [Clostridia bacterium]|nr:stage III sporulation protein AB [Clostridia bacterium]
MISAVCAGVGVNLRLSRRTAALDHAIALVGLIETRITYFLEPLDDLLAVLRAESPLLRNVNGANFYDVWSRAFADGGNLLKKADNRVLLRFGCGLGKSDVDGQRALCEETLSRLREHRAAAAAEKERFARLGAVLPVFVGAAVILIFV